jgi:protein SCO1/2
MSAPTRIGRAVLAAAWCVLGVAWLAPLLAAGRLTPPRVEAERYSNGRVRRIAEYRDGQLDGTVRQWYESGTVMSVLRYRRGLSEGEQRQWYESGQPYTTFHHHEGHEVGEQQMWNADGTVRSHYVIRDGRRYGLLGAMGCTGQRASRIPFYRSAELKPEWLSGADAADTSLHHIAPFRAVNQSGMAVTEKDLEGKLTIAHFFFTRCGDVCPTTTHRIDYLLRSLSRDAVVQVLSYSVTPDRDSVAALRAFAAEQHITDTRWHLLTGVHPSIQELARQSFFVRLGKDTTYGVASIAHTETVVLIDGRGRIRGVYAGTLQLEVDRLREDLIALTEEGATRQE